MADLERQRRLHVENRLRELNTKYGEVDDVMPAWLDHMPTSAELARDHPTAPLPAGPVPGPTTPAVPATPTVPKPMRPAKPPEVWERAPL